MFLVPGARWPAAALSITLAFAATGSRPTAVLTVILATFLVSHVTQFGSATGTLLNVSTLEEEGIAASTTGEAIGLTRAPDNAN